MSELNKTLNQLTLAQYILALAFLLGYGTALGSMFGPAGRLRALMLALLAAAGLVALTQPWEHGVLLVLCAIGGIGVFIAAAWSLSAIAASGSQRFVLQTPTRQSGSPELRDAAAMAVAEAALSVKRHRHHGTT